MVEKVKNTKNTTKKIKKTIGFHLHHIEIPQLLSCMYVVVLTHNRHNITSDKESPFLHFRPNSRDYSLDIIKRTLTRSKPARATSMWGMHSIIVFLERRIVR